MFSAQRSLQYWSHPMCVCVCLLCRALSLILFLFTFLEFCLFNFLRFVKVSLWSPITFFVCLCVCSNVCAAWVEAVGEYIFRIDWLNGSECKCWIKAAPWCQRGLMQYFFTGRGSGSNPVTALSLPCHCRGFFLFNFLCIDTVGMHPCWAVQEINKRSNPK